MKSGNTFLIRGLILVMLLVGFSSCSTSNGQAALSAVDRQEKAWEARDPSAANLSSEDLINLYNAVADQYPEVADVAKDRIARVVNWQTIAGHSSNS